MKTTLTALLLTFIGMGVIETHILAGAVITAIGIVIFANTKTVKP